VCIGEANRRAAQGHQAVAEAFMAGAYSELELHLLYLQVTAQDSSETPYQGIVALDENAAVLHHTCYGRQPSPDKTQSLLIDAGATCLGYASDITRTAVKGGGGAADVFAELVRRMEGLQAEVIGRVRPGLAYESLHDQAHELLAPILRDLGIARGSDDELVAGGVTRVFFPHGLGHSLGIQVHDVGCRRREPRPENRFLRNTDDIAVGQVFTIEPGCYFIPDLLAELRGRPAGAAIDWDLVDHLGRFGGVRIEDNIAVVDGGTVNLTRDNWPANS
jgi:Xaa-Pro dipeptidase